MSWLRENENDAGKTIIFNPGGFFLKILFSAGIPMWMFWDTGKSFFELSSIFELFVLFCLLYSISSLFGFAVNVTGNYLIGIILFAVLVVVFVLFGGKIGSMLNEMGDFGQIAMAVLIIVIFAAPFIIDLRKAFFYFRSTI